MLEHLEHQSLGAAGLAPSAKPARNKLTVAWLLSRPVLLAATTTEEVLSVRAFS
jgi:hypothetical protein